LIREGKAADSRSLFINYSLLNSRIHLPPKRSNVTVGVSPGINKWLQFFFLKNHLDRTEYLGVGNLASILDAKGDLIKKALGIPKLRFTTDEENISFPWFEEAKPDEALAYTKFISAICEMSKKQKRVTAKPKENENEKYAFRCFLLRLGFIGDEFKADRKILLSKLDGSAAFKAGAKKGGEQ